jgi:dGTPase
MDWNRLLSHKRLGRVGGRDAGPARTEFQRDADRIVFCSAFRRMQDKTQVFPLSQIDYVRTRLTHSLEASSVGRTLGTLVGERVIARHGLAGLEASDFGAIVAAACLAHDIGNPPFGHSGEDSIRHWFTAYEAGRDLIASLEGSRREDFLRFEGNAQGFRILTRLQNPDNQGGLQLTCATLATFAKYPRESAGCGEGRGGVAGEKFSFFQADGDFFREVAEEVGLIPLGDGQAWCRHPLAYLVEAADDICYRVIDIEDGFRLGYLDWAEVRDLFDPVIDDPAVMRRLERIRGNKERVEYLRARAISTAIGQVADAFMANEDRILTGHFNGELLEHTPLARPMAHLLAVAKERIYSVRDVVEIAAAGFRVLGGLLDAFVPAVCEVAARGTDASPHARMLYQLVPRQFIGPDRHPHEDPYIRLLRMTDFVAGMTDSYAVGLYKKITGISLPGG